MTIPKILLIRRQHSLNYSVAQRKNLDNNCKKNENKQTSKRKTKTKTNRRLDGPYTDPLRRGRTIGQSMQREREYKRTLHPYWRRPRAVVSSSLDPAQEQRTSRHHHFSFGTLTSQYAHGKSQTLSCFLCIQELKKYPIWNPPCGTASCGRLGAKHSGARRRTMMIGAPASSRDLIGSKR